MRPSDLACSRKKEAMNARIFYGFAEGNATKLWLRRYHVFRKVSFLPLEYNLLEMVWFLLKLFLLQIC